MATKAAPETPKPSKADRKIVGLDDFANSELGRGIELVAAFASMEQRSGRLAAFDDDYLVRLEAFASRPVTN